MRLKFTTTLFFLALCAPQPAQAHPHVWAETTVTALTNATQLTGYQVHWQFDEMYSESFVMEADTNGNGQIEAAETETIIKRVFIENPSALQKFFLVESQGQKQPFTLTNPKIWLDNKKILNYIFTVQFETPQNLETTHRFAVYDPEWYIEFLQKPQIKAPLGCVSSLKEDPAISLYFDMVNPEVATLACGAAAKR